MSCPGGTIPLGYFLGVDLSLTGIGVGTIFLLSASLAGCHMLRHASAVTWPRSQDGILWWKEGPTVTTYTIITHWKGPQTDVHDIHVRDEVIPHLMRLGAFGVRMSRTGPDDWSLVSMWADRATYKASRRTPLIRKHDFPERFPGVRYVRSVGGALALDWIRARNLADEAGPDPIVGP